MPPPVPAPPAESLTMIPAEVRELHQRLVDLTRIPADAPRADHEAAVVSLQAVWLDLEGQWQRALARAQAAGVSHARLCEIAGYKGRKTSQRMVYRGRELLAQDDAATTAPA